MSRWSAPRRPRRVGAAGGGIVGPAGAGVAAGGGGAGPGGGGRGTGAPWPRARGGRDGGAPVARWSAAGRPRRLRATEWGIVSQPRADVAILGGGPGGYEAALVAAQLGARVTVVEADGLGGACVLTDCVPSKTLIATS